MLKNKKSLFSNSFKKFDNIKLTTGEDCDICSEVLQETLEALQNLPEALLFDESKVSPVWIEILNKSSTFLQQVILWYDNIKNLKTMFILKIYKIMYFFLYIFAFSDVADSSSRKIPLVDRQYALRILLELAIQRGTITALIDMILLLLILSERKDCLSDNRLVVILNVVILFSVFL